MDTKSVKNSIQHKKESNAVEEGKQEATSANEFLKKIALEADKFAELISDRASVLQSEEGDSKTELLGNHDNPI